MPLIVMCMYLSSVIIGGKYLCCLEEEPMVERGAGNTQ